MSELSEVVKTNEAARMGIQWGRLAFSPKPAAVTYLFTEYPLGHSSEEDRSDHPCEELHL